MIFPLCEWYFDINWHKFEKRWADVFQIYLNAIHLNPLQFCPSMRLLGFPVFCLSSSIVWNYYFHILVNSIRILSVLKLPKIAWPSPFTLPFTNQLCNHLYLLKFTSAYLFQIAREKSFDYLFIIYKWQFLSRFSILRDKWRQQATSTLWDKNLTCEFKRENSFTLSKSCMKTEQFLFTVKSSLYSQLNLTTKQRLWCGFLA